MAARGRQLLVTRGRQLFDDSEVAARGRQLLVARGRQPFVCVILTQGSSARPERAVVFWVKRLRFSAAVCVLAGLASERMYST